MDEPQANTANKKLSEQDEPYVTSEASEKTSLKGWFLLALLIVSPFIVLSILWRGQCTNQQIAKYVSPDGNTQIRYVQTLCKATKPAFQVFMAQKTATSTGSPTNNYSDEIDILILQTKNLAAPKWGNHEVFLSIPKDIDVVKRREQVKKIKINITRI